MGAAADGVGRGNTEHFDVMRTSALVLGTALVLAGAGTASAIGEKATAEIKGRDGKEMGSITIVEATSGVLLRVKLKGLSPGAHGFHLHEVGKCEGDFSSAGQIYNPLGAKHGFLNEEGPMSGDLPNLFASAAGEVDVEIFSPFATLNKDAEEALLDANGAAFVIFEKADDYTSESDGNAGARIACGVIAASK
jgi:Cu-Zn family superoxide dismutase